MNTKTKNIVIITSVVAVGVASYFAVNHFVKKPKLSDEEKKLLAEMEAKGGSSGNTTNGSSNSNTNSGSNSNTTTDSVLLSDAKIILRGLVGWTTDNDEKVILLTLNKYNKDSFKALKKTFNKAYGKMGKSYELSTWLEDDLSDENYNKIRKIVK